MAVSKFTIEDSSKNWTINEFQNKILYIKSGEDIRYNKIVSNTANSITLQNQIFTVSNGASYEVFDVINYDVDNVNKQVFLEGSINRPIILPSISNLVDGDVISIKNDSNSEIVLYFEDQFDILISPSYYQHSSVFLYPLEWIYIIVKKDVDHLNGIYKILTKKFITQSDFVRPILNIGDNNNRIILNNYYFVYKTKVSGSDITFTILNNNLLINSSIITFELHIDLTTANTVSFGSNITWADGSTPIINEIKNYVVVFRSHDGGNNWIANLAYKY